MDISSAPPGSTGQDLVADPDGHEMLEVKAAPRKPHDWLHWMDPNSSKVWIAEACILFDCLAPIGE